MECSGNFYEVWYDGHRMKFGQDDGFTLWTIPVQHPHMWRKFDSTRSSIVEVKLGEGAAW